ncbi:MAG: amino acid ABC transporter permease [Thermoleophilia bacterium]|nr:amino acid ABC transporter permease [Thermoleophilia bacterium]
MAYSYHWQPVLDRSHALIVGAWVDVWVTLISFVLACILGIAIALLRVSGLRVFAWPAFAYVQLIRGVPLLVFLYWVYFGVAVLLGVNFTATQAAIIALTVTGSAYTAEIFRAGIGGVDVGNVEAATALGFTRRAAFRHVVFPQAFRIALPPLGNVLIGMLKGATLISVIGVVDMVFVAQQINLDYFTPFEPFTAVALLLIVLVAFFSALLTILERALRLP